MKLENLSALELGKLVNSKKISPTEVIKYFEDRIARLDDKINAFTYTKFEDAYVEAKKLERRLHFGEYCGPFAGVPIGLKDFLPSKEGWTNSHGGVPCLVAIDSADSEFYKAARKLGAIAIGKTNAPAFGFSGACQNKMYGATRNPFDLTRTSGGSSGGSAAAVASGMLTLAEGGDAGGSIRIPSGWCNLFGYKPSLGTVPSYCRPDGWAATHPYCFNGSLTKTVSDSAVMLSTMAQYNPRDPISLPINSNKDFLELLNMPLKGKRIAFTYDFDLYPAVDNEVKYTVYTAVQKLMEAGIDVEFVKFNFKYSLHDIMYCWAWSISVDTALDMMDWKQMGLDIEKDHADEVPVEFLKFNKIASYANIRFMRTFNNIRTDILDQFEDVFENYDYIVSPTAVCKPLPLEQNGNVDEVDGYMYDPELSFIEFGETPLANFVGYPAASVPAGLTPDNLPVGLQIIGKQYHDEEVLALSKLLEDCNPWQSLYEFAVR